MKRWLCAALAVCLLLCGCSDLPDVSDPVSDTPPVVDTPTAEPLDRMALAYNHDDTLNPFAVTTAVNAQLTGLLYESLIGIDFDFSAMLVLAESADLTDPTHGMVQLRAGMVFSDGSAITAEDVVTSFTEAKKSVRYGALLTNVVSAKADRDTRTVTFTLAASDPNWMTCLSFPVVKGSTLTTEKGAAPIGCGTYVLETTDTGARLTANPHRTPAPHFVTVELRHLPNHSARHHALASGEITYYYNDLTDGDLPGIVGANRAVRMNALVYLGVNSTRAALSKDTVRQALSKLLDRTALCTTAYASWAEPSAEPFHPDWGSKTAQVEHPAPVRDLDGAMALLDAAGYTPKNGTRLTLELIYSTDRTDRARVAELVRSQMEGGGVAITPVPLTEEEYRKRLAAGQYDLYIAEIRLTADMSLRPLLMGGAASYGISRSGAAAVAYGQYLSGEKDLLEFVDVFATDLPYIPVCWRHGLAAYDRRLTTVTPDGYNPYAGFPAWK